MKVRNGFVSNSSSSSFVLVPNRTKWQWFIYRLKNKLNRLLGRSQSHLHVSPPSTDLGEMDWSDSEQLDKYYDGMAGELARYNQGCEE